MVRLRQLHSGTRTQTRIGLIPAESLNLDPIPKPADVTVTLSSAVAADATTAAVNALTGAIARGTSLFFVDSGATVGVLRLSQDAAAGDTTINVVAAANAIVTGAVASHKGLTCIPGLTSTGFSIASQEQSVTEIICDEDVVAGELSGYTEGVVTSSSWSMPISGNVRESSPGYHLMKMAAALASDSLYVYVEHEIEELGGYASSSIDSGVGQVLQFDSTSSSDGFVTFSSNVAGRGAPTVSTPVV